MVPSPMPVAQQVNLAKGKGIDIVPPVMRAVAPKGSQKDNLDAALAH